MTTLLIFIFTTSFVLTFFIKKIALKKAILDIPNKRSSHTTPTPRLGGLAIALSWYLGISYLFINQEINSNLYYALLTGLILVFVNFLDDLYNISFKIKLFFQSISTLLALYFLGSLQIIDFNFFILEQKILLFILAFISIIWFINLFNFLDGIDGYAISEAIFLSCAIFLIFKINIFLILLFACLGFLPWNWQKAKIFMGDAGSAFLGFTIIILMIYYQNEKIIPLINFIILSAVFWFDATLTLFTRLYNKKLINKAHREHAYQKIIQCGFSHRKTVSYVMVTNIILFLLTYFSIKFPNLTIYIFIFILFFLYFIFKKINLLFNNRFSKI